MLRLSRSVLHSLPFALLVALTPQASPLPAFADDSASCGNGVVDAAAGEECDDGGTCIGGANASAHCAAESDCSGDGICQGGFRPGYACSVHADCAGGRCVHCVPVGGDGCAANCTHETNAPSNLVPGVVQGVSVAAGTSGYSLQSDALSLPYPLSGALAFTVGKDRGDGAIPAVIKAASVHLDRVHPPTLGAACLCARAVPAMTCGGTVFEADGTPSPDCTSGFTGGSSVCAGRKPCTAVHGEGNSAAGVIGCTGLPDTLQVTQDGSHMPTLPPTLALSGTKGSAFIVGTTAYVIAPCSGTDLTFFGPDGELCTDDDPQTSRGVPATETFISGAATAEVRNANGTTGSSIGPLSVSGASFCVDDLLHDVVSCLASASTALRTPMFGDVVNGTVLCIQPLMPIPTPTPPTASACIGDCQGDGAVTVNEIITMVNIALGNLPPSACPVGAGTCVGGEVCIDSIIEAVGNALFGCPRLGRTCAGIAGLLCGPDEACDIHDATCAIADVGGICVPSGGACPEIFAPVCGCDGVTYANDCFRLLAGATLKHTGSCSSPTPTTTPVP